jgi:hypothetical protein
MKQAYTRPNNSVLPPIPANCNMSYAQRSITLNHINSTNKYHQTWVITGLFADPTTQVSKALGKIATAYIDFDLTDSLVNDEGMVEKCYASLTNKGVTHIFKGGKAIELSSINPTDPAYASDIVKAVISSLGTDKIKATITKYFVPMMEQHVIPFIGKPQKITYTGHGCHAYYWVADDEGYTNDGATHATGDVKANANDITDYFKSLFAHVNSQMGYDAVDPKVKDLGTRCTRECGTHNIKNSDMPRLVEDFLPELVEADTRLSEATLNELPEAVTKSKFVEAVASSGRGRPASFKPAKVEYTEAVMVQINGKDQEMTVEQLDQLFDEIIKAQGQVDKVRNVRLLDQLGQGSLNMYAVRPTGGRGLMFITTASKYMKQGDRHWKDDGAGNYLGYYLYDGLAMHLLRDAKGRIKKNTYNIQTILMNDPRLAGKLQYNSRLETVFVHRDVHLDVHGKVGREVRVSKNTEWFRLNDNHYITFEKMLNDPYGLDNISDGQMQRCLKAAAMQLSFDPVTDWVESIKWDGIRRLDGDGAWICKMLGMPRNHAKWDLYAAYGRCVMLGILRNIYIGNTYPDVQHVLTLTGGQGTGKSLCASILALTEEIGMDYFHDSGIDMGAGSHKGDQIQSMLGCFLVELPEAISLSSSSTDASIKAFLTTKKDKGRMAYGREQSERLRSTYFVTNSNDHIFLSDHTGNRRYLVVDGFDDICTGDGRLDIDSLRQVLPQLYAEAYRRCVLGLDVPADRKSTLRRYEGAMVEDWNLTLQERDWQNHHNEKFTQPDYIVEQLGDILTAELERGVTHVSYAEVKTKLAKRDPSARLSNIKFANAMTRCGWRKASVKGLNRWLPTQAESVVSRPRIKPVQEPAPVVLQEVANDDLEAMVSVFNSDDFKAICPEVMFGKITTAIEAIRNSATVMPAQLKLVARQINRVIADAK